MTTADYLQEIATYWADETSSEHSYRTAFQNYLETIFPKADGYYIQQDAKAVDGNKPDFIVLRHKVPVLYIEVKKVGEDLDKIETSSQAERYFGYTNLIISDYVEFRFFRNGERYEAPISLGVIDTKGRGLTPAPQHGEQLARTIRDFTHEQREPIKRGAHLAKIMGGKAQRIRDNVVAFLDGESDKKDELERMRRFIKEHLLSEFSTADFADMYAQTLVYGLFAARYNDDTLDSFSRQEARDLVPATNPFLKSFFDHISGNSFPPRLEPIVTELCEVFAHANVRALMEDYFKQGTIDGGEEESPDPVIHFYEDFLREYDPGKKADMGVFYTPLSVVRFIVRGLDELLKTKFDLAGGLSDTSTVTVTKEIISDNGKRVKDKSEQHRVQLLDVAVGTGTFLNETVRHIHTQKAGQQGRWNAYVNEDLLPRLHGFELMMASYTIAHLKLAMTLRDSGVREFSNRLGVYLTNTLDDAHDIPLTDSLFGVVDSIAMESKLASEVKQDKPIMVVMGNPPYSGISQNKHYTENDAYKVEPGGKQKLQERKHWLDDDYVKFIRFAESMVEKEGEGIIGMITAHGYLDNPTFRGMRWHLRQTFDVIYVLDLHGNSNKKETAPDGSLDHNVFDIKTGVAVIFGVKHRENAGKQKPLATVYEADLYGLRAAKFAALEESTIASIDWNELPAECDVWRVEGEGKVEYEQGFSVAELFPVNTTGIVTMGDKFIVAGSRQELEDRVNDFLLNDISEPVLKDKYGLGKNYAKWIIENKRDIVSDTANIVPVSYRPFDTRYTYFDNKLVWRPRTKAMQHFLRGENVGLDICRQVKAGDAWQHIFVNDTIIESSLVSNKTSEIGYTFPLYLYTDDGQRVANLNEEIVAGIAAGAGRSPAPEDILDYVYAYLHAPRYRTRFSEFLKTDFPRVPYPAGSEQFAALVVHGRHLRQLHLLTHPAVRQPITTFPEVGSDMVEKLSYDRETKRVYINNTQYWQGVPESVWNFFIGGYQPAQKYLKDRKGARLTSHDFDVYEQLIVALLETEKVMGEIDTVLTS